MTYFRRQADRIRDIDSAHQSICAAELAYECAGSDVDKAVALADLRDAQRSLVEAIAERVSANRWPTRPVTVRLGHPHNRRRCEFASPLYHVTRHEIAHRKS